MSIKRFCDCCGKETAREFIEKGHATKAIARGRTVTLKVELEFLTDGGDICELCLADVYAFVADELLGLGKLAEASAAQRKRGKATVA